MPTSPRTRILAVHLGLALALTLIAALLHTRWQTPTGLTLTFHQSTIDTTPVFQRLTGRIDLQFLEDDPQLPRRLFVAHWSGVWYLADPGDVDFYLGADDRATLRIDGRVAIRARVGVRAPPVRLTLAAGPHDFDLVHIQERGGSGLNLQWAPADETPRPFDPDTLFPTMPDPEPLARHQRLVLLRQLSLAVWLTLPLMLILVMAGPDVARLVAAMSAVRRRQLAATIALVAAIVATGHSYYTHHLFPNALAVALGAAFLFLPPQIRTDRRWRWIYWLGCAVLLIGLDLAIGVPGGMGDFRKAQYKAGSMLLTTPNLVYDDVCGAYAYLPLSGLLFVPFGVFPRETAYLLYTMVGRLTVLAITYALASFFKVRDWKLWLLLILIAFNGPLDRILWLGNSTHFILLLLIAAFVALDRQRPLLAGIAFGLAPLLKLSMLLLGGYFILRRRWTVVAGWAGALAASIILSLIFWEWDLHAKWLDTCLLQFQGGAIPAFRAQSIDGFLAKHYLQGNINDWTAVPVDATFKALHYLGVLLVMAPALWATQSRARREPGTTYLELCMFICAAILISPISWSHYYSFLLLPIAFYAGDRFPHKLRSRGLARTLGWTFVVSVVLFSLPEELSVEYYDAQPQETGLARALLSHYFYGGVLFYCFLVAQRFTGRPEAPPSGSDVGTVPS